VRRAHEDVIADTIHHLNGLIPEHKFLKRSRYYSNNRLQASSDELKKYHDGLVQHSQRELEELSSKYDELLQKQRLLKEELESGINALKTSCAIQEISEELEATKWCYQTLQQQSNNIVLLGTDVSEHVKAMK
jgi:serine phosphatase RsbU (regulator of sigma subunit)